MSRPADDGFSLPGAWIPHSRCWLAWPTRVETWGEHLDAVRETYSETANAIARFEPVTFIAKPKNVAEVSLTTGRVEAVETLCGLAVANSPRATTGET